ncbi:flocculation protein FLO11-like [Spodoptera litura]|uniref:Flocculation protein FLO11-like n=1 Tax=Spodoptera litura TaxID=69820 RepID=A0A9J7EIS9_SPOLT|nr:flocculation protein FLO11-like [Spodoptera litura]
MRCEQSPACIGHPGVVLAVCAAAARRIYILQPAQRQAQLAIITATMRTAALILVIACAGYITGFTISKPDVVGGLVKIKDGLTDLLPSIDPGTATAPAPAPTNSTTNSTAPAPAPAINDTALPVSAVPSGNLTDALGNLTNSTDPASVPIGAVPVPSGNLTDTLGNLTNSTDPAAVPISAVPVPTGNLTGALGNLTNSTDTAAVPISAVPVPTGNLTEAVTNLAGNDTAAAPAP